MYQQIKDVFTNQPANCIQRLSDNAYIPFDTANTDYANFKKDLADGVEFQDAEGNVIDGIAYLKELV
jgi:hypothetical protein